MAEIMQVPQTGDLVQLNPDTFVGYEALCERYDFDFHPDLVEYFDGRFYTVYEQSKGSFLIFGAPCKIQNSAIWRMDNDISPKIDPRIVYTIIILFIACFWASIIYYTC